MRGAKENSVSNDRNDRKFSDGHDRKTMYPDKNIHGCPSPKLQTLYNNHYIQNKNNILKYNSISKVLEIHFSK